MIQPCSRHKFGAVGVMVIVIGGVACATAAARPLPAPGEIIIGSRGKGTVYGPVAALGQPSTLMTGPDLSTTQQSVRGSGPSLSAANLTLLALDSTTVLARPANDPGWGLFAIDVASGNRSLLPGTSGPEWATGGEMMRLDRDNVLAIADDYSAGTTGNGKLLRYSLHGGTTTTVSGGTRGDGFVINHARALARLDDASVAVVETGPIGNGLAGAMVYRVDLATGDRQVISTLWSGAAVRYTCTGGVVSSGTSAVPVRGTGPLMDGVIRGLAYVNGSLYVSGSLSSPFPPFFIRIDPATGDRTLVAGTAIIGGSRVTVAFGAGSTTELPDAPTAITPNSDHSILMCATFGPNRVWQLDVNSGVLTKIADLDTQIVSTLRSSVQFTGLTVVPQPCGVAPGAPLVLEPPSPVTACLAGAAGFSVSASVVGNASYQWRRASLPIDTVANPSAATPTLVLSALALADAGLYDCVITDDCNQTVSPSARLSVLPDLNGDHAVNTGDLTQLLLRFGQEFTPGTQPADLNGDGTVNTQDLTLMLLSFGASCG